VLHALAVTVTGGGSVASQPAGITCGSSCTANFAAGTAVTLTATPAAGQVFSGWGGACSGTAASCVLTLGSAQTVSAGFAPAPAASAWSAPVLVSAGGADAPRVVIDSAGNATAVWLQLESSGVFRRSVWASRRSAGAAWSAPVRLETSESDIAEAELAIDADSGQAMVVWTEHTGGVHDVWARPADASGVWGTAARIDSLDRNVAGLRVAVDPSGRATAVWSQLETNNNWTVWSNRFGGASGWSTAARVANDGETDLAPQLALSGAGEAFVVWTRSRSGVWASRAPSTGVWGTPTRLAEGLIGNTVASPRVVTGANGTAVAVWAQGGVQGGQFMTQLVSKRFAAGAWSATVTPVGDAVASTVLSEPRLAANAQGVVAVAWGRSDNSVLVNQMSAAGSWGTAAVVRPAGGELRSLPAIGIDASGDLFTLWSALNPANARTELAINRHQAGSGWVGASLHQTGDDGTGQPGIAMNARGHAASVWIEVRATGSHVLSRYFTSGR